MLGFFKKFDRCSRLHDFSIVHHHDLVSKCKGFSLIVSYINHGALDTVLQLFHFRAQLPLEMGVNHRQWLIEHDDVYIRTHEPAPQ